MCQCASVPVCNQRARSRRIRLSLSIEYNWSYLGDREIVADPIGDLFDVVPIIEFYVLGHACCSMEIHCDIKWIQVRTRVEANRTFPFEYPGLNLSDRVSGILSGPKRIC